MATMRTIEMAVQMDIPLSDASSSLSKLCIRNKSRSTELEASVVNTLLLTADLLTVMVVPAASVSEMASVNEI